MEQRGARPEGCGDWLQQTALELSGCSHTVLNVGPSAGQGWCPKCREWYVALGRARKEGMRVALRVFRLLVRRTPEGGLTDALEYATTLEKLISPE